ncbi:uroporphyrinogen-III synthase [Pseudomonas sp. Marseille-QA0892]
MTAWRLLLTRPTPECEAQAAFLDENGVHGACLPLLAIQPLAETPEQRGVVMDLDLYAAVIVISKPAARYGLARIDTYWPQLPVEQRWFAVGSGTAAALADYGIDACWPEGADSEALLAMPELNDALAAPGSRVLILRGEGGREALQEGLSARGVKVDTLELYQRSLPAWPEGQLGRVVQAERLNGLVVSSGQGFEHLRQLAGDAWPSLSQLTLFVPSARVADLARAAGHGFIVNCGGASNDALLAALATNRPADD